MKRRRQGIAAPIYEEGEERRAVRKSAHPIAPAKGCGRRGNAGIKLRARQCEGESAKRGEEAPALPELFECERQENA